MIKRVLFTFLVITVAALLFHTNIILTWAARRTPTSNTFRITTDPTQQSTPQIFGDIAIWTDWRNSTTSLDIYSYDIQTASKNPLLIKAGQQWAAGINQRQLIYNQYLPEKPADAHDVWAYNLETQEDEMIVGGEGTQFATDLFRDSVVYIDGYGVGDLYVYNLKTGKKYFIADNAAEGKMWGKYLVWYTNSGGRNDVKIYDLSKKEYINLPDPDGASRSWPSIFRHHVAYNHDKDGISSIRVFDLKKMEEAIIYQSSDASNARPVLSDKYVVWSHSTDDHLGGVMATYLKTGEFFMVQKQGPHQNGVTTLSVWQNKAVWQAWRTGNGDIYGSEFEWER